MFANIAEITLDHRVDTRKGLGCAISICYGVSPSHPRPQGSSSLPRCRGPQHSPSELPFCGILCPFSRCPLENANQWIDFVPKTSISGARRMALPRRGALLAQSWTKPEQTIVFEQPCDDPCGAGESHRDFVKASHHLVLRVKQQPRLVQHRGFLPVPLFLSFLTWKLSCWPPSEEQV